MLSRGKEGLSMVSKNILLLIHSFFSFFVHLLPVVSRMNDWRKSFAANMSNNNIDSLLGVEYRDINESWLNNAHQLIEENMDLKNVPNCVDLIKYLIGALDYYRSFNHEPDLNVENEEIIPFDIGLKLLADDDISPKESLVEFEQRALRLGIESLEKDKEIEILKIKLKRWKRKAKNRLDVLIRDVQMKRKLLDDLNSYL